MKPIMVFVIFVTSVELVAVEAGICYPLPKRYIPGIKMCDLFVPNSPLTVFFYTRMEKVRCFAYCVYSILSWLQGERFVISSMQRFVDKHIPNKDAGAAFIENSVRIIANMTRSDSLEIMCANAATFYKRNNIVILPYWRTEYLCLYERGEDNSLL